jgi:hypothetical protein
MVKLEDEFGEFFVAGEGVGFDSLADGLVEPGGDFTFFVEDRLLDQLFLRRLGSRLGGFGAVGQFAGKHLASKVR